VNIYVIKRLDTYSQNIERRLSLQHLTVHILFLTKNKENT
jgi:hypothetical protein